MVTEPDPANGNNTLLTNYSYNAANQLVQVQMTRGTVTQTRTFQWTGSDLTQSTNPENGTVTYTYDGVHHVTQRVDAVGQRTTYAYDSYGRLLHVRHYDPTNNEQAGQDVDYGYDDPDSNAWGRLSTVSFGAGSYEYGYNTAGRVTAHRLVRDDGTTEADYQWDNRGRMTHMSEVDTLNYQYDAMSRLVGMTDANNGTVATATYDGNSQLSELDWGGLREVRQYNQLQQLTRMTTTKPLEGTTLMDMQYIYVAGANNGRVTQTIDGVTGDTQAFGYDALNRLVSVTSSLGNNESMGYDGFGNLTSMNGVSYTVDPTTNRRTGGDGTTTYDANGNVTQWGQAGYGWDIENRMTSNGAVYDPWGKRAGVGSQVYFYSLSGQRLTGPNGVNRYFGGKLIQSNGVGVATDRLGSVRANGNGDRMVYKAYGTERTSTADGREKFGTYFRDGTGLDYADQRYYGDSGRFLSPDPGGIRTADPNNPTTWNRYSYANGDPANFFDPTGTYPCGATWADGGAGSFSVTVYDCPDGGGDGGGAQSSVNPGWVAMNYADVRGIPTSAQNRWNKATAILSNGNDALHNVLNGQLSQQCQNDVDALQMIGITSVGILAMADTVQWNDASAVTDKASGLFVPGSDDYQMQQAHGAGQTISGYVSGGTKAVTALPGSALWGNIYFDSSYVVGLSTATAAALLMHEVIHSLGATDDQIQLALFGPQLSGGQVGAPSDNITQKFKTDCFQ